MEVLKTVSLSEGINFNLYKGPLGLLCSGGADSSLMLYFVLKNYTGKDPIHVFDSITILRFKKYSSSYKSSKQVCRTYRKS